MTGKVIYGVLFDVSPVCILVINVDVESLNCYKGWISKFCYQRPFQQDKRILELYFKTP